jgi:uncharacterized protein with von Willebrand factor type A (vWA) domain
VKGFIYKKWDGSQQPFSLKRKEVIDTFMDNIMKGMSPNMSLAQMLWEGFPLQGMDFRVMGLEELLEELEKQKRDLFDTYNLEKAFDKPMDDLKSLLAEEAMTRRQYGATPPPSYNELPPGLLEKIRQLKGYDFKSKESRDILDSLDKKQNDILDLYEFYSRYSKYFKGDQYLDFDQAVELMRLFESIDQTRQQILTGQFSSIDPETLRELLGEKAEQSFNIQLQLPEMISEEGIVQVDKSGFSMTPRGVKALGQLAFGKTFHQIKKDRQGGHEGNAPQNGEILPDSSRPYEFGDRFDLDITRTVLESIKRPRSQNEKLKLQPDDFYVREREQRITSTTVLLLDLSWSMSWGGRFEAGKRVALALDHYIRTRFPKDRIHIIGFSTVAKELKGNELALSVWDAQRPYTNLQDGLRLAMRLIKKSGNRNNRVIIITDGQPTAYYQGEHLHVELPDGVFGISPNACKATLAEVRKVTAQGMNIDTFMLDDNPVLIEFTKQIAKINRGRAVMCLPGELGELIIIEEVKRRGGKI